MPVEEGHKSKLSLHSSGYDKSFEKINVLIKKFKNLSTTKVEGITLYAKAEFNETSLGESTKVHVTPENIPDLNFNFSLNVNTADPNSLDDICNKPIIITLFEVLPKDKKQKEEKVQPYGQATIDLHEFVRGRTDMTTKLAIYPVAGSALEAQMSSSSSDNVAPEFEAKISVDQPLLLDEEISKTNLMTITLESMFSPPESWISAAASKDYAYSAVIPVPVNDEKDTPIVFVNGVLKSAADTTGKNKRWADTRGILAPNAIYMSSPPSSSAAAAGEDLSGGGVDEWGDFVTKEDKDFRASAEKEKPKIVWSSERRCFLNANANNALKDQVLKTRFWPVEVIRTAIPSGTKGKKEEDLNMSYHGVVYLDFQPLLYPGATHIRGAYKIHPFVENDFTTKTKRKGGTVDDATKIISTVYDKNFAVLPTKKDQKVADKKDIRKQKESTADTSIDNQTLQQIIDSKSFVIVDIKFEKPLIPRKPFEYLTNKVSELIPPRPKYPIKTNSAQKAVEEYHAQLKSIINLVLEDYRNLSLTQNDLTDGQDGSFNPKRENENEIKRRKLLYELNASGKYFAFKEQLKNSVIKIVREKFLRTSAFDNQDEFEQFLSELYVFLVDEMHKLLNDYLVVEDEPQVEIPFTDLQQLKHFAVEAEINQNYDLAAYYYQERIAREKDNYSNWLDYAVFNLLIDDALRAEECLKECISIDPNQTNALMLYSVICAMQDKLDTAETFLERVTAQESENVIAWTLYMMLYEQKGQDLNAEITLKKVLRINQAQLAEQQAAALASQTSQTNAQAQNDSSHLEESGGDPSLTKRDDDLLEEPKLQVTEVPKSRNSKRGTLTQATKIKLGEGSTKSKSPGISSKNEEPQISYKDKLVQSELAITKSIYMRTAQFLIKHNAFVWAEKCMAKELLNPNGGPSCQYNILLTKIKLAKNELNDAEKYCVEALQFDYMNSEAWILWAHIRYIAGDLKGAKERYERILLFPEIPNDQVHSVYIRLASIYLKEEKYEDAKKLFLHPCKSSPSCMAWLGVGICCYRLDQLEDAKIALSEANILNNKAPEVWAYLSLISLRTNRPLEAEQAYKYAIRLNLDNSELLEEIHNLQEQVGFGNPEF